MANNQIIISRIQNRRGLKENLPQPLLPGEIALTVDTGELWIGSDPNQPPYGVRTYSSAGGDIGTAEGIVDAQIASAKFNTELSEADYEALVAYLTETPTPAVVLTEDDILWDGLSTIFIAADISVDAANTINNVLDAVLASTLGPTGSDLFDSINSGALGALNDPFIVLDPVGFPYNLTFADANPDTIVRSDGNSFVTAGFFVGQKIVVSGTASNDGTYTIASFATAVGADDTIVLDIADELVAEGPIAVTATMLRGRTDPTIDDAFDAADGDFQFGSTSITSNSVQASNAAILINEINGAGLVTTFGNLQITTSGIGVGSPAFSDVTVTDTDSGYAWSATGTASADSTASELTIVSGTNINIDVDTTLDAVRISNTAEADPDKIISGFTQTPIGDDVQTEYVLTPTGAPLDPPNWTTLTGFALDIDADSDIAFVEYSLSEANRDFSAAGRMRIVANSSISTGDATLLDDQTELRNEVGDAFAANTVICANFNGADAATAFTETARSEPAVFIGNAQLDTAQFNFATSSLLLDGTQDAITFGTDAADWAAYGPTNTDDFTVEAFVRFAVLPTAGNQMTIAAYRYTDSTIWELEVNNNGGTYELRGRRGAAIILAGTITPSINTWYHAALQVRGSGSNIDLLWAGNRVATGNGAGTGLSNVGFTDEFPIIIGGYDDTIGGVPASITKSFNGHIDDFRYTVGTARYGTGLTYTVPASPLCAPPAPLEGDVTFQAVFSAGTGPAGADEVQLEYQNTFSENVTLRAALRRWMSY